MAQPINNQGKSNDGKTIYSQAIAPYSGGGSNNSIRPQNVTYAPTNDLIDRAFDADTVTVGDLADVLATLIRDLAAAGTIKI